jgi:hypothetical protein
MSIFLTLFLIEKVITLLLLWKEMTLSLQFSKDGQHFTNKVSIYSWKGCKTFKSQLSDK